MYSVCQQKQQQHACNHSYQRNVIEPPPALTTDKQLDNITLIHPATDLIYRKLYAKLLMIGLQLNAQKQGTGSVAS